jgi:hypothetical protein
MKITKIQFHALTIEGDDLSELLANDGDKLTDLAIELAVYAGDFGAPVARSIGRSVNGEQAEESEESALRAEFEQANGVRFTTRGKCDKDGALGWLRDWKASGQLKQSGSETAETGAEGEEL